ncbi:M6 family metalloprotease domain-containing protein [uncultured Prevotella sp.]|uniref:M6 family metalloprotease domain-containing protein n=1 Tax=uncultured Prevotella sp. TaxID=159272 RepID=UPI00258CE3EB|nr:M6 family metalloprotease domain-containing protein [uncultured Prevotella sp.]
MKKILFLLIFALVATSSFASKANSLPAVVPQPDGTMLTVLLQGDENISWYTTTDGMLLVKRGNGYYVAQVKADGSLAASSLLAHGPAMRGTEETNMMLLQDKAKFAKYSSKLLGQPGELPVTEWTNGVTRKMKIRDDSTLFPHMGSPKALVILVEFTDTTFTLPDPKASFNDYLNNETGNIVDRGHGENRNAKGVKGYFKDMSFGQFTPKFDVVGPVKLSHPLRYYGAGNDNMSRLIPDACSAVNDSVDFSQYDSNGDGYVDLVYVIYAGHSESEAGNSTDDIWPKSGYSDFGTFDGKKVYRYGVNNELNGRETSKNKLINGIGLFCHEFSHTMGLPDIYATSGAPGYNKDNFGMEFWDLMDGGEYVHSGRFPTAYTSWEREVMGWMNVDTLTDTAHVVLRTIDSKGDSARSCKIVNPSVKNEAIYLQNIQNKGWNYYLPGHGLLVYRVSYASENVNFADNPNNGSRPRIVCIPADGKLGAIADYSGDSTPDNYYADMAGDTYPGTSNVSSIASFTMYNGDALDRPILNIEEDVTLVSFDYLGKKIPSAINSVMVNDKTTDRIFNLNGMLMGTDKTRLPKGIYIINGKKVVL